MEAAGKKRGRTEGEEHLTQERIEDYLEYLSGKGRSRSSLESYRRILSGLYDYLPGEKSIGNETGPAWKSYLEEQGFSAATVDNRMSAWNSFMQYLGHREWQMGDFHREKGGVQPELTRTEYLRLLSAAKHLGKEKAYLLIKTLGGAGMRIQELPQLTVEALERGAVELEYHNSRQKRLLRLPQGLREELMDYARREGLRQGPVFQSPEGLPMARSSINYHIGSVCGQARVGEEKANPRCLWKMYQSTCAGIRDNIAVLVDQAYQRMVEEEQMSVGWRD